MFLLLLIAHAHATDTNVRYSPGGVLNLEEALLEAENLPSYFQFFNHTAVAVGEFVLDWKKYPFDPYFVIDALKDAVNYPHFYIVVIVLALLFTWARVQFTNLILQPYISTLGLRKANAEKVPESVWKGLVYSCMWLYSVYVMILSGRHTFFQKPCHIWESVILHDNFFRDPIPLDIEIMYVIQTGFYLHSIYATLRLDTVRADTRVMLGHHIVTSSLLTFSYMMRLYKIGALVLFVHDISDTLLEFTKLNVYLKWRHEKIHRLPEILANIGFVAFTVSWAWFRLYWFPLKVLHATTWCVYLYHKDGDPKMFTFFNSMLYILFCLHIYWFWYILLLLYRIVIGRTKELEDVREQPVDPDSDATILHGGGGKSIEGCNGYTVSNGSVADAAIRQRKF